MTDERLGLIFEDHVTGFIGKVTAVAEYYGRQEKMLELTANTGPNGDEKIRWIPETRGIPHGDRTTGF